MKWLGILWGLAILTLPRARRRKKPKATPDVAAEVINHPVVVEYVTALRRTDFVVEFLSRPPINGYELMGRLSLQGYADSKDMPVGCVSVVRRDVGWDILAWVIPNSRSNPAGMQTLPEETLIENINVLGFRYEHALRVVSATMVAVWEELDAEA